MLVNAADILLKVILILKTLCYIDDNNNDHVDDPQNNNNSDFLTPGRTCDLVEADDFSALFFWMVAAAVINVVLGLVSCWTCYANNFLHWGAIATWLLLLIQGQPHHVTLAHTVDSAYSGHLGTGLKWPQ